MFFESIKMAVRSLISNKMRALLTMLGIIVGIGSVISIVSLGEGGKREIMNQFEEVGTSTAVIQVVSSRAEDVDYITSQDMATIKERVETLKHLTAVSQTRAKAYTEMANKTVFLSAMDSEYERFMPLEILYGRSFGEIEFDDGLPVAVIDNLGARELFGRENAVGEQLTLDNQGKLLRVTIVGISESMGSQFADFSENFGGPDGHSMPVFVYTPLKTAENILNDKDKFSALYLMATSPDLVDETADSAIRLLELRKGNEQRSAYRKQNFASILEQVDKIMNIITIFISAVAAISLLVGGIGVMNIMLVSVTERTREIGIRKAIGATTSNILMQFITESVIITLIGGILGIAFGLSLSFAIAGVVKRMNIGMLTPFLDIKTIVLVVLFSSAVGLFFGIYPAKKASNLDPIEALRHE